MKRVLSILFALALVLAFSLVATAPVGAQTTYYVATTGSDITGDGSAGNPWLTIQHAVNSAASLDTIIVAAGTYFGATVNKDVTIQANPGDTVIINDGPNTHPGLRAAFYFPGDYSGNGATISGFQLQGFNQGAGSPDDGKLDFGVFSRGADGVTIQNNVITDMLQAITNWHGSNWLIDGNQIIDLWTSNGGGIGILVGAFNGATVSGNVISNNQISGTLSVYSLDGGGYDGTGIVLYADFRYFSGGVVTGNTITGNDISMVSDTPGVVNFNGIELTDTRDSDGNPASVYGNQVVQNNVHDNSGNGILVSGGTSDNHINFNNIDGNQGYGVLYSGTTGGLDATNNWWGAPDGPGGAGSGGGDDVSGGVEYDPWLDDPYGTVGWETYRTDKVRVLSPYIALLVVIVAGVTLLALRRRRAQN